MDTKPTHVYIARRQPCNCCLGVVTDMADEMTAEGVAGFIKDGMVIERVNWKIYKENISKEETFMECPHGQLRMGI